MARPDAEIQPSTNAPRPASQGGGRGEHRMLEAIRGGARVCVDGGLPMDGVAGPPADGDLAGRRRAARPRGVDVDGDGDIERSPPCIDWCGRSGVGSAKCPQDDRRVGDGGKAAGDIDGVVSGMRSPAAEIRHRHRRAPGTPTSDASDPRDAIAGDHTGRDLRPPQPRTPPWPGSPTAPVKTTRRGVDGQACPGDGAESPDVPGSAARSGRRTTSSRYDRLGSPQACRAAATGCERPTTTC